MGWRETEVISNPISRDKGDFRDNPPGGREQTLNDWVASINHSTSPGEVLSIVDRFRQGAWSDDQRAHISRTYIRKLDALNSDP